MSSFIDLTWVAPVRIPLPKTVFGKELTEKLYARYHSLVNKSKAKGIPFHFKSFVEFLEALGEKADEDYHPTTHRVQFDLKIVDEDGAQLGYCIETMQVKKTKEQGSEKPVNKGVALTEEQKLRFMGELTSLILGGFDGSIEELTWRAKEYAGIDQ